MNHPTPTLMVDVASTILDESDKELLKNPHIAGVILFGRNVESAEQVRSLTDSMRAINPALIIATDQEGGRVARLREGFTPLPAMGRLGNLYKTNPKKALKLAEQIGYVMACEVLAVGIDMSFAPVLDIDNGSLVIGDRAFCQTVDSTSCLASAFIDGMNQAGMKATGKHFPGHGSVIPDSHTHDATDDRTFDDIWQNDTQTFIKTLDKLSALMPAHVVFSQVDDKPAGFSKVWLQDIIRTKLGFDGVLFSDDLSMKAAHIVGGVEARVAAALTAGCDVALVCNDRIGTLAALAKMDKFTDILPTKPRFQAMKATIPVWQGDLISTCQLFEYYDNYRNIIIDTFK